MAKKLPLEVLKDLLRVLSAPFQSFERICHTEIGGLCISTVYAPDIQQFETAVCDLSGNHPVERYATVEQAKEGHQKWVALAPKLVTVVKLGYCSIIADATIILDRGNHGMN